MSSNHNSEPPALLRLQPVSKENWRAVAQLKVTAQQAAFVAEPSYYLALCCYEAIWHPLAVILGEEVIGFCMWGIDPADQSCWLGGVLIDQRFQGRGYGRRAIQAALAMLAEQNGCNAFALSYNPSNDVAKRLYQSLGFRETGELEEEEEEVVARLQYFS
jgi:diamine N-acetyltransferase